MMEKTNYIAIFDTIIKYNGQTVSVTHIFTGYRKLPKIQRR